MVGALSYDDDSPQPVRQRYSSTPAHTKTPPLGHMAMPFTDQNVRNEQKIAALVAQLAKLQVQCDYTTVHFHSGLSLAG